MLNSDFGPHLSKLSQIKCNAIEEYKNIWSTFTLWETSVESLNRIGRKEVHFILGNYKQYIMNNK